MRSRSILTIAMAAFALALVPGMARADTIFFDGSVAGANPVNYTGKIDVTAAGSGTSATIKVTLTNTTSSGGALANGFITGFGINVPTLNLTSATGSSTDADFKFLKAGVNATSLQGGAFDYAFSTSASQLHTVAASEIALGLGATQSATFTINLTGTGLGGLTALQISKELSAPTAVPFSVRFRSTNVLLYPGHNSPDGDKVPFRVVPGPQPPAGVPAPAGLVLGLIGVGGMLGRSLRRKTAAAVTV